MTRDLATKTLTRTTVCLRCLRQLIWTAAFCVTAPKDFNYFDCGCQPWRRALKDEQTPGPWLESNRTSKTHNHPERYWERNIHTASDLLLVGTASGASQEEAEANARLIAAAPTMLIALRAIKRTCPDDADLTREFHGAWGLLEAAIAKAEGR